MSITLWLKGSESVNWSAYFRHNLASSDVTDKAASFEVALSIS